MQAGPRTIVDLAPSTRADTVVYLAWLFQATHDPYGRGGPTWLGDFQHYADIPIHGWVWTKGWLNEIPARAIGGSHAQGQTER